MSGILNKKLALIGILYYWTLSLRGPRRLGGAGPLARGRPPGRPTPGVATAGPGIHVLGLRLCCFVLQHLDSFALRDDFLVGQAVPPVTAGRSRRLVAANAALQAAAPISSALFEARYSA